LWNRKLLDPSCDIEIGPSISVEISPTNSHAVSLLRIFDAGFSRDLFKGSVAPVPVKEIGFAGISPGSSGSTFL